MNELFNEKNTGNNYYHGNFILEWFLYYKLFRPKLENTKKKNSFLEVVLSKTEKTISPSIDKYQPNI